MGSSFDVDLINAIGQAIGEECRAKSAPPSTEASNEADFFFGIVGTHVLLGPTVNTQRSPLGGRGFESFSEDPHLNGTIAAAYINGLQSKGVSATIKHFATNDQEFERRVVIFLAHNLAANTMLTPRFSISSQFLSSLFWN